MHLQGVFFLKKKTPCRCMQFTKSSPFTWKKKKKKNRSVLFWKNKKYKENAAKQKCHSVFAQEKMKLSIAQSESKLQHHTRRSSVSWMWQSVLKLDIFMTSSDTNSAVRSVNKEAIKTNSGKALMKNTLLPLHLNVSADKKADKRHFNIS